MKLNWLSLFLGFALVSFTMGLTGCATNPVTGKNELNLITERGEIQIGEENYKPTLQVQGGAYVTIPSLTDYVNRIGQKLAAVSDRPELPYEFVVINNPIPNAWALPGGKIAINRGLLEMLENEAELAAVLAHEIVHAAARHSAQQMERQAIGTLATQLAVVGVAASVNDDHNRDLILGAAHTGMTLGSQLIYSRYGREAESESDYYGMKYMKAAGYDTQAAVTLQEKFVKLSQGHNPSWLEGLFASHPPSEKRVIDNRAHLSEFPPGGFVGKAEYQAQIAPLITARDAYADYQEGVEALEQGKFMLAIQKARSARSKLPREALFDALEAKALYESGKNDAALETIESAIVKNPEYFAFHLFKGNLENEMGRTAFARGSLERSNQLLPTAEAMSALGLLAMEAGDNRRAYHYLTEAAVFEETEAGQQAFVALKELNTRLNPKQYIQYQVDIRNDGRILVLLRNTANITLDHVSITITLPGKRPERFTLPKPIAPGSVEPMLTNLLVADESLGRRDVYVTVIDARVSTGG